MRKQTQERVSTGFANVGVRLDAPRSVQPHRWKYFSVNQGGYRFWKCRTNVRMLHQGHENQIQKAYEILKAGASNATPVGPCDYSPCQFRLIDKFGVCWCLFV